MAGTVIVLREGGPSQWAMERAQGYADVSSAVRALGVAELAFCLDSAREDGYEACNTARELAASSDSVDLLAEVERLRLTLACERGQRAPLDWQWTNDGMLGVPYQWKKCDKRRTSAVWRGACNAAPLWHWQAHPSGGTVQGTEPTALEACEAADNAGNVGVTGD